ncbi:MAG TPA: aldolase/citrate lyase family protein [Burkholderiaceae bacterium]|nr:aldolase/citrate lyase family protein [Burkholderiaceae bacterium]
MNPLRQLLMSSGHQAPLGTWIMAASPLVTEAMGHAGFQWGVIDMEHTPLDMMEVIHLLQAAGNTKMVPIVRVPWNDAVTIKRVLDAGATTLLIPFVQSADEAARAVAATRYPPEGTRGLAGMSRGSRFGTTPDYARTANKTVGAVLQLETPTAVAHLEAIAAVPGVDSLFMGPGDLSAALGHAGNTTHPEVMAMMSDAARRANAVGMPIGTVGGTPELVVQYRAMGFNYVAIGSDLGLLMRGAQAAVKALTTPDGDQVVHTLSGGTQTSQGAY